MRLRLKPCNEGLSDYGPATHTVEVRLPPDLVLSDANIWEALINLLAVLWTGEFRVRD